MVLIWFPMYYYKQHPPFFRDRLESCDVIVGNSKLPPLKGARRCLAECGVTGLMDSVEPGRACGSDTSHLAIFGQDPRVTYRGRGAFESLGAGCSMAPGDIAFKSNLATLGHATNIVKHRRVDRSFEQEGPILCDFLNGALLQKK
jgi:2,3-bisphosphoglycerate-independent phosphoglycerate mutase